MHTGVHSFWSDVAANTDTSPESEQTAMRVLQRLVAVAMALPAIWTSDVVARAPLSMGRKARLCTARFRNWLRRCLSLVRWHYSTRLCDAERSVSTSASHESSDAIDCIEKVLITKVARTWAAKPRGRCPCDRQENSFRQLWRPARTESFTICSESKRMLFGAPLVSVVLMFDLLCPK